MACGCSGSKTSKPKWVVTARDGQKHEVTSLSAAITTARKTGGTYQRV